MMVIVARIQPLYCFRTLLQHEPLRQVVMLWITLHEGVIVMQAHAVCDVIASAVSSLIRADFGIIYRIL